MGSALPTFKSIVAAALAAVWFSAPLQAQQSDAEREADLLAQLREAEGPYAASLIERQLNGLWSRSGSAAVDLLYRRGEDALEAGNPDEAIEHFSAAIDWAPDFAASYTGRAIAFYLTDEAGLAIADLRQALALNPNDWNAMQGFAVLLEEIGQAEDALEVWRMVHDMHPQNTQAQENVGRLELLLQGRTL